MLDALDEVPWGQLHCACGNAAHVPGSVRGLLSSDPALVEQAYWQLENHVVAQGHLSDSALHLLPTLFEVLSLAPHPSSTLRLLFEIGNSWSEGPNATTCYQLVVSGLETRLTRNPTDAFNQAIAQDLADLRSSHTTAGARLP